MSTAPVLLVDDEIDNLDLWETALKPLGLACDRATSGHEAFAKTVQHGYKLAILDLLMPNWDGFTTLQAMRIAAPLTKIIVISAYIDDLTERKLAEAENVITWFRKPPNLRKLRDTVNAALAQPLSR